jgi:RNA polymerase sigma factor (sigma-70 family)
LAVIDINHKISLALRYRPMLESSDAEILELMKNPFQVEKAFNEFYQRYKNFVFKVCQKVCSGFIEGEVLAKDIFQHTFIKVHQKGYTFKPKGLCPQTNISGDIKAWLSRIAKNELINYLRKNPDEKSLGHKNKIEPQEADAINAIQESEENIPIQTASIKMDILNKGLNLLSPSEKNVLMTYMTYYDPRDPNRHLPDDVLKNLCMTMNIKSGSIRQIKRRAIKKLKRHHEPSLKN